MPKDPSKTEKPTYKALEKAQGEGQVVQSQEMTSFVILASLLAITIFWGPAIVRWSTTEIIEAITFREGIFDNSKAFSDFLNVKIISSMGLIIPILLTLAVASLAGKYIVSGWTISTKAFKLRFDSINPANGMKQLIDSRSIMKLVLSIAKIIFVGIISWLYMKERLNAISVLRWTWTAEYLTAVCQMIVGLSIRLCLALLVIGIADTWYQKWKHIDGLMMSKQEKKDERRQEQGPPEIQKKIRQLQLQMTLRRMIKEVPEADVVLVNPTHVAVALKYDAKKMDAPLVIAKGADHLAEKIREIARAYGVPIIRKPELARTLYASAEPGDTIPEKLYVAVAEVLSMIYRLRHMRAG